MPPSEKRRVVIRLVDGHSEQEELVLEVGRPISPLAIGASATWRIAGRDVADAHVMLAWNGTGLFVGAARGQNALLDGFPLATRWTEVRMPSELLFGGARLKISRSAGPDEVTEAPGEDHGRLAHLHRVEPAAARRVHVDDAVTCLDDERLQAALRLFRGDGEVTCIAEVEIPAEAKAPVRVTPDSERTLFVLPHPSAQVIVDAPAPEVSDEDVASMPPTIPSDGLLPAARAAYSTPFAVVVSRPSSPTMAIPQPAPSPSLHSMTAFDAAALAVSGESPRAMPTTHAPVAPAVAAGPGALLCAWRQASFPSKAIAVLLAPALVAALFAVRVSWHGAPAPSHGGAPASAGIVASPSAEPSLAQSGVPLAASAPMARAEPSASASPAAAGAVEAPRGGVAGVRDTRSAERRALDTVASGHDALAAEQYEALAVAHPESAPFREAARILRERAAGRRDL